MKTESVLRAKSTNPPPQHDDNQPFIGTTDNVDEVGGLLYRYTNVVQVECRLSECCLWQYW